MNAEIVKIEFKFDEHETVTLTNIGNTKVNFIEKDVLYKEKDEYHLAYGSSIVIDPEATAERNGKPYTMNEFYVQQYACPDISEIDVYYADGTFRKFCPPWFWPNERLARNHSQFVVRRKIPWKYMEIQWNEAKD